jgi:hypothetical protein
MGVKAGQSFTWEQCLALTHSIPDVARQTDFLWRAATYRLPQDRDEISSWAMEQAASKSVYRDIFWKKWLEESVRQNPTVAFADAQQHWPDVATMPWGDEFTKYWAQRDSVNAADALSKAAGRDVKIMENLLGSWPDTDALGCLTFLETMPVCPARDAWIKKLTDEINGVTTNESDEDRISTE